MRTFPYIALSLVLTAGLSSAASYTVDFDDPAYPSHSVATPNPIIDGIDGWSQSVTTPPNERFAWISTSFDSGNSLTYGGYFSDLPPSFSVGRTFIGLAAGEKSLSFQSHITDIAPPDPVDPIEPIFGRDKFGFQIRDSGGDLLLTVNLVPVPPAPGDEEYVPDGAGGYEPGEWEIFYAFGSDALTSTTNAILSTGINLFSVDFGTDGLTFNYGQASGEDPHKVRGTADGYDVNDTEIDLAFTYEKLGDGENHIRIDNINVVDAIPEPTTAALAALGSLALMRRRRTH